MNDSELDQLLKASGTSAGTPAGFQRDVWLRIEAAESAGWKPAMDRTLRRFLGFLALPPVALGTCAAMIMAGVWIGLQTDDPNGAGEMAYVESISPFTQSHR